MGAFSGKKDNKKRNRSGQEEILCFLFRVQSKLRAKLPLCNLCHEWKPQWFFIPAKQFHTEHSEAMLQQRPNSSSSYQAVRRHYKVLWKDKVLQLLMVATVSQNEVKIEFHKLKLTVLLFPSSPAHKSTAVLNRNALQAEKILTFLTAINPWQPRQPWVKAIQVNIVF